MNNIQKAAVGLALLAAAGCSSFLNSDDAIDNPNAPTRATRDQLLVAVQAGIWGLHESGVAQTACMWVQACSGVGGRFVEARGTNYTRLSADYRADFAGVYTGSGLLDLRNIQAGAEADGDLVYRGVAKVLEALLIGFAADAWGDIPYSDAVSDNPTPAFDDQLEVYAALQALLTSAIADLGGAGDGPGAFDLAYGGDKTKWTELANTLKARYYLHTAEGATRGTFNDAAYQNAITAATAGISSPSNDYKAIHSAPTSERNIWFQFTETTFGQDLVPGHFLVELMKQRNDPRLSEYFVQNSEGGYGGNDVNSVIPASQISSFAGAPRFDPLFAQPLVTWDENQLILAEAKFQTGGGAAAAAPHVNAVRARYGLPPLSVSQVTLETIIEEKYVALFQNPEVWSDYRRTCFPVLDPAGANEAIPGRVLYGDSELNANPNTPSVADQNTRNGGRNPNDPSACTP
jgi:hypothetical protein